MTTDNRTNEITEDQVEAAAKAIWDIDDSQVLDPPWDQLDEKFKRHYRTLACAALVATAGVAPQAESVPGKRLSPEFRADLVEAARDRIQAVWDDVPEGVDAETMAQNVVSAQEFFWLTHAFPVVQQVSISELAELIAKANYDWSQQRLEFWRRPSSVELPGDLDQYIARAVLAALGGESRASRE